MNRPIRPMLSEGDCILIDQVMSERIDSETDVIFAGALANTLGKLRAIVAEKKAAGGFGQRKEKTE